MRGIFAGICKVVILRAPLLLTPLCGLEDYGSTCKRAIS
jgi:hypothetical protein